MIFLSIYSWNLINKLKSNFSDEIVAKNWLKINRDPENVVLTYLNLTFTTRRKELETFKNNTEKFLLEWPIFKSDAGHVYVSIIVFRII